VIVPGGFSYGDYLRAGAIARFAPMMREVEAFAAAGGPVLGICNGFQVLCEAGLLPGVLRPNHHGRFVCRDVDLVVQRAGSPWLPGLEPGDVLRVPVKHHDGAWYAPPDEQERAEAAGQVALRYADNPNGALADIACVTNAAGNVCGLMPHPEHAVDPALGPIGGRPLLKGLLTLARARSKKASPVSA
jgi:phosphoribosylformylglycinamidine synthase